MLNVKPCVFSLIQPPLFIFAFLACVFDVISKAWTMKPYWQEAFPLSFLPALLWFQSLHLNL